MKQEQYFLQETLDALLLRLCEAELQETDLLKRSKGCGDICIDFLRSAHQSVVQHGFPDAASEICFFKHVKPAAMARLKYYQRIYQLHLYEWKGSHVWSQERLVKEMTMVEQFFEQNRSLWQYYRSGSTYMDEQYFLRVKQHWLVMPGYAVADPLFATQCDGALADLLAMELYAEYIGQIVQGNRDPVTAVLQGASGSQLIWTAPAAHAAVFGYALHHCGVFNNGQVTKKSIMHELQSSWKVDLRNHSQIIDQVMRQQEPGRPLRELLDGFNRFLSGKEH